MRPVTGKSAARVMRVATALTGVVAGTAIFGPAQTALANTPLEDPYRISVKLSKDVGELQVCGYKSLKGSPWECTGITVNGGYNKEPYVNYMGSDWRRGKVNVWVWNNTQTDEHLHTCNTNGGYFGTPVSDGARVILANSGGFGLTLNYGSSC
jgi:hypothetical protein